MAYNGVYIKSDQKHFNKVGASKKMEVTLRKTYNTVYAGSVWRFQITPNKKTEFSEKCYLHVGFPTMYTPELGNVVCVVNKKKVPCEVKSPWWLRVTGPSTPTGQAQQFTLLVKGIR